VSGGNGQTGLPPQFLPANSRPNLVRSVPICRGARTLRHDLSEEAVSCLAGSRDHAASRSPACQQARPERTPGWRCRHRWWDSCAGPIGGAAPRSCTGTTSLSRLWSNWNQGTSLAALYRGLGVIVGVRHANTAPADFGNGGRDGGDFGFPDARQDGLLPKARSPCQRCIAGPSNGSLQFCQCLQVIVQRPLRGWRGAVGGPVSAGEIFGSATQHPSDDGEIAWILDRRPRVAADLRANGRL